MLRRTSPVSRAMLSLASIGTLIGLMGCETNLEYLSAAPAASGGSASTAGTAGGGEAGGGTAPMGDGGMTTAGAPRTAVDILTEDGRIVADSNHFGIDGEWRKFGADPALITTSFVGPDVCIAGNVVAGDWGGGLQLVLHNGAPAAPAVSYDAPANGMAGLQLVIEGPEVPAKIRVKYKLIGEEVDYCRDTETSSGDEIQLLTADAQRDCWMPGGEAIDATQLENFELHIVPDGGEDITFDFCVKNVVVVPLAE